MHLSQNGKIDRTVDIRTMDIRDLRSKLCNTVKRYDIIRRFMLDAGRRSRVPFRSIYDI